MSKTFYILVAVIVATFSVSLYFLAMPYTTPSVAFSVPECRYTEKSVLNSLNRTRTSPVVIDQDFDAFAESRLPELRSDWSHNGYFRRASSLVYPSGEILAKSYCGQDLIDAWLNSPTHKAVMLDERYDVVGIAGDGVYTVVIFGDVR